MARESTTGGGDDYADFMEKAQAKFKERDAILQNATPSTRDRLLKSMHDNPVSKDSSVTNEPSKQDTVKESSKKFSAPVPPRSTIETSSQHVKENINKFERIATSNSKSDLKDDQKAISVKEMKRRFENDSSAIFPNQGPNAKSPKVSFSSPSRPIVQRKELPTKSLKPSTPVSVYDVSQHTEPKSPKPTVVVEEHQIEENQAEEEQIEEEQQVLESPAIEISVSPNPYEDQEMMSQSPISLFGKRLRTTMEPLTPRRARLMDEINEDFQRHSDSLPRQSGRTVDFEDDSTADDNSSIVSLRQYRQDTLNRMTANDDSSVEKLVYTSPVPPIDMPDSAGASKKTDDRLRQLEDFVSVCQTQLHQAEKALLLTTSKSDRDERDFIAANHILLNHRVVLEAAMRVQNTLIFCKDDKFTRKLPEMRASFSFRSVDFELNPEFLHQLCVDGSSCYFTVVIGHNETTRCSQHICYTKNKRGRMSVDFYCAINNVEPGFTIFVQVYMLKIPKATTEKRSTFADTVGTLLRGEKQTHRSGEHRNSYPQFVNVGTAEISHRTMRTQIIKADTTNVIASCFSINFEYKVAESNCHFESYLRRFETVGGAGNWSMEYMEFSNWFLNSWVNQREKLEGKPAIRSTNLRWCLNAGEVSDSACYPHAFFIEYATESKKQERMLLAAPTNDAQDRWLKVLKSFVEGLKYWN